jgi:large subunit ribosomal protein L18
MKLVHRKKTSYKTVSRLKKKIRIRKKLFGTDERPRLNVYRSAKHIYAQIVDDVTGNTLVEASTLTIELQGSTGSKAAAKAVGVELAKRAGSKKIKGVLFDRNGFSYHGRIQALADGAREGGLNF